MLGSVQQLQAQAGNRAVAGLVGHGRALQRHPLPTLTPVPFPLDLTDGGTTTAPAAGGSGGATTTAPATGGASTATPATGGGTATASAPVTGGTTTTGGSGPGTTPAATTLTAPGAVTAYATAAENLRRTWASHADADARGRVLGQAAISQLTAVGVHPPTIVMADLPAGNGGNFAFTTWSLTLARAPFAGATPDPTQINNAIEAVFHEARHCEQWFRMARLRAGQGRSAAQIASDLAGIPAAAAAAAHAAPIAPGSAEATEATVWWNSVYGSGATNRNAVLTEVMAALTALNAARAADASASTAATRTALTAANTRFTAAYTAYRALPEEADAFATEGPLRTALAAARAAGATPTPSPAPTPAAGASGGP